MRAFLAITMMAAMVAGPAMAQMVPAVPSVSAPRAVAAPPPPMAAAPVISTASGNDVTYSYHLGASDQVKITIFGEPDLSGTFTVTGEGKISVPLIGDIRAMGLSAPELQTELQTAYEQGYLKDPKVNVEVLKFKPFYILGEVKLPGEYPYDNGMTVVKAVALAQGFTYRADQKRVFIKHLNGLTEQQVPLTSSQPVEPGDTVRITERYF